MAALASGTATGTSGVGSAAGAIVSISSAIVIRCEYARCFVLIDIYFKRQSHVAESIFLVQIFLQPL